MTICGSPPPPYLQNGYLQYVFLEEINMSLSKTGHALTELKTICNPTVLEV